MSKPISEALREITDPEIWSNHDIKEYADALAGSNLLVGRVISACYDTIVFETVAGTVFKVGGKRLFD